MALALGLLVRAEGAQARDLAAQPGPSVAAAGPAGTSGTERAPAPLPARRQREIEELRRQDLARDLEARGVTVRWEEHPLAELLDWRDRVDAARALAADTGVRVDWRTQSAGALVDMRLRAAKAAELRTNFGLVLDWRRYTWPQLEKLRHSLVASNGSRGRAATRALAVGERDRDALAPFDPQRRVRRQGYHAKDPDGIIEPHFASALSPRRSQRFSRLHPDGIFEPNFSRPAPRPSDRRGDALAEPRL